MDYVKDACVKKGVNLAETLNTAKWKRMTYFTDPK